MEDEDDGEDEDNHDEDMPESSNQESTSKGASDGWSFITALGEDQDANKTFQDYFNLDSEEMQVVLEHIMSCKSADRPIRWDLISQILYPDDNERKALLGTVDERGEEGDVQYDTSISSLNTPDELHDSKTTSDNSSLLTSDEFIAKLSEKKPQPARRASMPLPQSKSDGLQLQRMASALAKKEPEPFLVFQDTNPAEQCRYNNIRVGPSRTAIPPSMKDHSMKAR